MTVDEFKAKWEKESYLGGGVFICFVGDGVSLRKKQEGGDVTIQLKSEVIGNFKGYEEGLRADIKRLNNSMYEHMGNLNG